MSAVEGLKIEYLGSVAQITMGQTPDSKYYSEEQKGLPFLQGCAEFQRRFPKHTLYCSETKKVANSGSILFSVRAPVGKINVADRDYIIGRGLAAILSCLQAIFLVPSIFRRLSNLQLKMAFSKLG